MAARETLSPYFSALFWDRQRLRYMIFAKDVSRIEANHVTETQLITTVFTR